MCERTCLYVFNFVSVYMCEIAVSESFERVFVRSGCCVRCQQSVEMLRLKSDTPRFVSV